ncbi:hypothetical protein [Nocardiopsis chromatogenes]|uniref:hypothetical protein n=1 Tax=Nocardiopsis chromatogenes TaxID=280239 RepID=UPI00034D83ED|nr:hypothetical protein [Nocardiopsis chromatogenes]
MKRIATTIATGTATTAAAFAMTLSLAAPASAAQGRVDWTNADFSTDYIENPAPGCHTLPQHWKGPIKALSNHTDTPIFLALDNKCQGIVGALPPGETTDIPVVSFVAL